MFLTNKIMIVCREWEVTMIVEDIQRFRNNHFPKWMPCVFHSGIEVGNCYWKHEPTRFFIHFSLPKYGNLTKDLVDYLKMFYDDIAIDY